MPPPDNHKPAKRKNQSVKLLQAWQVLAENIPMYFEKESPLDPGLFVFVQVVMLWPPSGKASLADVQMSEEGRKPARFFAFFTGDCTTGFFRDVKPLDKVFLYLSDATVQQVEGQCKQNTLNLPFTLTWDKTCRLRHVEKGMVDRFITFPTRKSP